MKRMMMVLLVTSQLSGGGIMAQELMASKDGSVRDIDTRAMVYDSGETFLATRNEVYRATGERGRWESIFTLPPGANEITSLAGDSRTVFAGSRRGLYRSADSGRTWKSVFKAIIPEKSHILCIDVSRVSYGRVIIGTGKGVYASSDTGDHWTDISANIRNKQVFALATVRGAVYACASDGLYIRSEGQDGWSRICVRSAVEGASLPDENDTGDAVDDSAEQDKGRMITCIAAKNGRVYIGCGSRILYTDDAGRMWKDITTEGLAGCPNAIAVSQASEVMYCATTKGVFIFSGAVSSAIPLRWQELYKGTDKIFNARSLAYADETEKAVWAMTDRGLYRLEWMPEASSPRIDMEQGMRRFHVLYDNEPSFSQLQRAAMDFAEVGPEKVAAWRKQAKLKALIPKISVGIDHGTSTNNEIYTSATQKYVLEGPADNDDGWDATLSWELSDLVWSDDQTNIDVRSRLTTQLRNDILDDLRRVYFERKRILFELVTTPPQDQKLAFEKELRVQELTQAIDDLTGNYLSKHTKRDDAAPSPKIIKKQG